MPSMVPNYSVGLSETKWQQTNGLTLYAVCESDSYRVEYNCNSSDTDSKDPTDLNMYDFDDPVVLKSYGSCVKPGSTKLGWQCVRKDDNNNLFDEPQQPDLSFGMPASGTWGRCPRRIA